MAFAALRLRHFEVFLAVARSGSMQNAARSLRLTQPAVSKLIGELEAIFGARLFERSRRGVALTECGKALVARGELFLNDLASAEEEVTALALGATGRVRVGVLPVAENRILPITLLSLIKAAPKLSIQIEAGTTAALLNSLRRGEIECVVGRLDHGDVGADLRCEKLIQMPIKIVVAPEHPLARAKRPTWRDLSGYPWVTPPLGAPVRTIIDNQFVNAGVAPPKPVIESTAMRLLCEVVRGTDMIGVMAMDAAADYARLGLLSILDRSLSGQLPHVGVITRTGHVSAALRTFLKALRRACETIAASSQPALKR